MRVIRVLRYLLGRRRAEIDLAEEMAEHQAMHRRDLENQGADLIVSDSTQRTATQADVYKMHTYRDALAVESSIIVYPGRIGDGARFYRAAGGAQSSLSFADLFTDTPPSGVGYLPLSPEDTDLVVFEEHRDAAA